MSTRNDKKRRKNNNLRSLLEFKKMNYQHTFNSVFFRNNDYQVQTPVRPMTNEMVRRKLQRQKDPS